MAQKTIIRTYDDLDGEEFDKDGKTVPFSLEGVHYEIDLRAENLEGMRSALSPYVTHARRVGGRRVPNVRSTDKDAVSSQVGDELDLKAVRSWATSEGIKVSHRGRVPEDVKEKYRAAHS